VIRIDEDKVIRNYCIRAFENSDASIDSDSRKLEPAPIVPNPPHPPLINLIKTKNNEELKMNELKNNHDNSEFSLKLRLMAPYSCINTSLEDIQDILQFANFVTTTFPSIAEKANAYVDNLKTQNPIPPN